MLTENRKPMDFNRNYTQPPKYQNQTQKVTEPQTTNSAGDGQLCKRVSQTFLDQ